jgi:hypothetical protein
VIDSKLRFFINIRLELKKLSWQSIEVLKHLCSML